MVSDDLRTDGALPAHASPGWSPFVYRPIIENLEDQIFPLPGGGGKTDPRAFGQIWFLRSATEFRTWLGRNG